MKNVNWKFVLDKVGTVIVDRRLWVSVFTLILLLVGTPEMLDNVDTLSDQSLEIVQVIVQLLAMIGVPLNLVNSWTKRPPSGLGFKDIGSDTENFIEELLAAAKK